MFTTRANALRRELSHCQWLLPPLSETLLLFPLFLFGRKNPWSNHRFSTSESLIAAFPFPLRDRAAYRKVGGPIFPPLPLWMRSSCAAPDSLPFLFLSSSKMAAGAKLAFQRTTAFL